MPEEIKFYQENQIPLEMHKVKTVQKLNFLPAVERYKAIQEAGYNTFLLKNRNVFLDMLTDSGVNAMSDRQQAAMFIADDSYAGSETYYRLENQVLDMFNKKYFLPAHQGRACESIISQVYLNEGALVPMNYHFTTTKAHININGGQVEELFIDEALNPDSEHLFKGNMDLEKLKSYIESHGAENIAFVRMEAGANLIGGQPFSLENLEAVREICDHYNLKIVLDASLLQDNLYLIKMREAACSSMQIAEINQKIADLCDIIYFSARKLGCARGGGMCMNDEADYYAMRELVPLYEGFLTYGGMSVREMEALTVGLQETLDMEVIEQGPQFIKYLVNELREKQIPVVAPAGGLGAHLDAMQFVDHLSQKEYPAGSLAAALYLTSGIRAMERGTMAEERDENGEDIPARMELVRLALPRRVFTLSQVKYAIDRVRWLYDNRHLIGGLKFVEEPSVLRFFFGRLEPVSDWPQKLLEKFKQDFGEDM